MPCLEQTLGLKVFLHVGQVVIVEAVGGRCAGFLVPTELLVHHGKGGLEVFLFILSVPAVKGLMSGSFVKGHSV